MIPEMFQRKLDQLLAEYEALIHCHNPVVHGGNGLFDRFQNPVLTALHTPVFWRYDLDHRTNPHLMERLGINSAFNPGAIELGGTIYLVARVEGVDRKSFFAVAESKSGTEGFRFWDYPLVLPETSDPDVNVYDMRLVAHEDGWIYGLFCTERKDPKAPRGDLSRAVAQCGIVRTKDLKAWDRLDDLKTSSPQQRNVVLHPELMGGKYAFYTRPQDGFIEAGSGGGIGWGLADSIEHAELGPETIVHDRKYHTVYESKNGLGPAPIKTSEGWLQLAHGVRGTAAGLRYVLYAFMTRARRAQPPDSRARRILAGPRRHRARGRCLQRHFLQRVGCTIGWPCLIYYASSDTRCHVAATTVEKLVDYCKQTPRDPLRSAACVQQRIDLIRRNLEFMKTAGLR